MRELNLSQARRIALAAQGFADPAPTGRVDVRLLRRVMDRVGLLQLDSVNVVVRSHYLPPYSRLGPYPTDTLDSLASYRGELFEYWGHAASLMPIADYPLMRHRMQARHSWGSVQRLMDEEPGYVESVLDEVRRRGPLSVGDLEDPGARTGPWWGRSKGKLALEWQFSAGNIGAIRTASFGRVYDLPERMYPEALRRKAVPRETAHRELLRRAARSLGVATAADLADYYRLRLTDARPRLDELVAAGDLQPVKVEGWPATAYLDTRARAPRRVDARALLSPFDSLVWFRDRTERLFGFHYRIEIYVPRPKREFGYYVLPFLLGDQLVGRVDTKALRKEGALAVHGAYVEPGHDPVRVAQALAAELEQFAGWLGLDAIRLGRRGNLMPALRRH